MCVNPVFVTIEWNFDEICSSVIRWDREGDLSGGSAQVQWPHGLCSMRMNPSIPYIFLYRSKWTKQLNKVLMLWGIVQMYCNVCFWYSKPSINQPRYKKISYKPLLCRFPQKCPEEDTYKPSDYFHNNVCRLWTESSLLTWPPRSFPSGSWRWSTHTALLPDLRLWKHCGTRMVKNEDTPLSYAGQHWTALHSSGCIQIFKHDILQELQVIVGEFVENKNYVLPVRFYSLKLNSVLFVWIF